MKLKLRSEEEKVNTLTAKLLRQRPPDIAAEEGISPATFIDEMKNNHATEFVGEYVGDNEIEANAIVEARYFTNSDPQVARSDHVKSKLSEAVSKGQLSYRKVKYYLEEVLAKSIKEFARTKQIREEIVTINDGAKTKLLLTRSVGARLST